MNLAPLSFAIVSAVVVVASPAFAQSAGQSFDWNSTGAEAAKPSKPSKPASKTSKYYVDHDSLYLRSSLGIGYLSMNNEETGADLRGAGPELSLALGGAVGSNLILHFDIRYMSVKNPEVSGVPANESSATKTDITWKTVLLGGGFTQYFMPANVYVSGSGGFGYVLVSSDGADKDNDDDEVVARLPVGYALSASVGKEWKTSKAVGMGLSAFVTYTSTPSGDARVDGEVIGEVAELSVWSGGMAFNLSFN